MVKLAALLFVIAGCDAGPPTKTIHAKELFDHPEWIGKTVRVDLDEPMRDSDWSSLAAPGELDIDVADVGPKRLELARADGKYISMQDSPPPAYVTATLRESAHGLRLEATSIEPHAWPKPIEIVRAKDILDQPKRFSGAYVTFEGTWLTGFEASVIDQGVWMDEYPMAKTVCEPPRQQNQTDLDEHSYHVRVTGVAHTAGKYGHMSMAKGEIVATEIVFLDPERPECR
ncbi:MAG: hypothetical protein QM831_28650 [Kofleriaceae bacterium]